MDNATSSTAANTMASAQAKAAMGKILRQRRNENATIFFAAGMAGIMALFMIFNWCRVLSRRFNPTRAPLKYPVMIPRVARSVLIRKVPGFTSVGHALVFVGYFATCTVLSIFCMDWTTFYGWANRLGWVAVANLALVSFLSLKNTPLAFLTSYSYERLNILHQIAGYGCIFWSFLHGCIYVLAATKGDSLHDLQEMANILGIVAAFAMLVMAGTALLLRRLQYEVFYIIHIMMFMLVVIGVGMHRPHLSTRTLYIVIVAGSLWVADRTLRFLKISLYSFGNTATVTPLENGATRVVLRKSPMRAVPGSHYFLWIPAIRPSETHPFTIVSLDPLEFVITSHDGFTRDLHKFALQNPGETVKASIDGPYGVVPDFTVFTKVLFIAGGSGATYTFATAVELLRKLGYSTNTTIEFVWVVRNQENISWFSKELKYLNSSHLVNLTIHCTSGGIASTPTLRSTISSIQDFDMETFLIPPRPAFLSDSPRTTWKNSIQDFDMEKLLIPPRRRTFVSDPRPTSWKNSIVIDFEKYITAKFRLTKHHLHHHSEDEDDFHSATEGRPDVEAIITELVACSTSRDRIAVVACGPKSLMSVTRKTVARCIRAKGPSVELHCEQFGW